jgi:hypothetical protein
MTVKVIVTGTKELVHYLNRFPPQAEAAVKRIVARTAMHVASDARQSILRGPKTGRLYSRGRGKFHQASAPGEAPANDTGTLASRLFFDIHNGGTSASVFSDVDYAPILENGGGKIAPRPFLGPALDKNTDDFVRDLELAIQGIK